MDVHCERFVGAIVDEFRMDSGDIGCQGEVGGQQVVDTGAGDGVRGAGNMEYI